MSHLLNCFHRIHGCFVCPKKTYCGTCAKRIQPMIAAAVLADISADHTKLEFQPDNHNSAFSFKRKMRFDNLLIRVISDLEQTGLIDSLLKERVSEPNHF